MTMKKISRELKTIKRLSDLSLVSHFSKTITFSSKYIAHLIISSFITAC